MAQLAESAWKIIPQLQSLSISETIQFYTQELYFVVGGVHPSSGTSKPNFCSLFIGRKAEANIYFFQCEAENFHPSKVMIALGTSHLDEFYNLLASKGMVEIVEEIQDKEWGYRQFAIKDCGGNILTFFCFLEDENDKGQGTKESATGPE